MKWLVAKISNTNMFQTKANITQYVYGFIINVCSRNVILKVLWPLRDRCIIIRCSRNLLKIYFRGPGVPREDGADPQLPGGLHPALQALPQLRQSYLRNTSCSTFAFAVYSSDSLSTLHMTDDERTGKVC